MDAQQLPDGWTLWRIRDVSQVREACLLPDDIPVAVETHPDGIGGQLVVEPMSCKIILGVGDCAIVLPNDESDWYVGSFDGNRICCWASYGPDLGEALRAL